MGPGSRGHNGRLAGDTNCAVAHSAQRRIPGRTREAGETREPALNLIQGPCRVRNRDFVAADSSATSHQPLATSRLYSYPRTRRHLAAENRGPCCTNSRDFVIAKRL